MVLVELVVLLVGLSVVSFFSARSVDCSTHLAKTLKVPPLIIGVVIIAMGTDIPEIANSIFSSYTGYGDINVGNTIGSSLTQISLILGLVAIIGGTIKAHRKNIILLGLCATAAVAVATIVLMDGSLTREDGALLILSYAILLAISAKFTIREFGATKPVDISCSRERLPITVADLIISLMFVVVGTVIVVESAIGVSEELGLPEYFVSFFIISLGTSLPELSVGLASLRKKNYGLVLGNLMGSNIADATFALGIGPFLFPTNISAGIVIPLVAYVVLASAAIIALFAWREKIDKYAGLVLIGIYLLSFLFVQ